MKTIFTNKDLDSMRTTQACREVNGREYWAISKPLGYESIVWRIKASIQVLKGKAFPVEWI
jgi:hypothetical protein